MGVVPYDANDLPRVVRLLWAWRNPFHEQEGGNSASTNRTASIDDDAASQDCTHGEVSNNNVYGTICVDRAHGHHNCADAGPTMMPTGTIPGGDAFVVLNDVLASLKMRTAAAKPAWFEGRVGIHTPYLHMCHSHIISLSLSLCTRSSVVSVHISSPHSFVTSTTCTCVAQVSLKQARQNHIKHLTFFQRERERRSVCVSCTDFSHLFSYLSFASHLRALTRFCVMLSSISSTRSVFCA